MERKQRERNIVAKMDNSAGVSELDVTDGTRNVEQAPDSKLPFFSKERKAENERQQKLYLDNFCSFAAGFMLFVLAVISFGLITVIATKYDYSLQRTGIRYRLRPKFLKQKLLFLNIIMSGIFLHFSVEINFRSSATDFRITLSEHYTEVHPNYWQVSSSETVGVYYHMKYQGLDVWRYVHIAELWMWAQGDNTKVANDQTAKLF